MPISVMSDSELKEVHQMLAIIFDLSDSTETVDLCELDWKEWWSW